MLYSEGNVNDRIFFGSFSLQNSMMKISLSKKSFGKPSAADDDRIKASIDNNPQQTTRDITEELGISQLSVENNHLHK